MLEILDFILFFSTVISLAFALGVQFVITGHFTNPRTMKKTSELLAISYHPKGELWGQVGFAIVGAVITWYLGMWYLFTLIVTMPFLILIFIGFLKHRIRTATTR